MTKEADPLWVKGTMVEDYLGVARRNGKNPSAADIERLALSDLEMYQAFKRNQRTQRQVKRVIDHSAAPAAPVQDLAASMDAKVIKRPIPKKPRGKRYAGFMDTKPKTQKEAAAILRLGKILQPASWFRPSKEFDYVLPALAKQFTDSIQQMEKGHGEFAGKSSEDARRIMWRKVEDICDKSTGRLGPWWVK